MSEQASAVIKLTKSEIEYNIIALVLAEETSFTLSQTDYGNMFNKLKKDFIKVKDLIIEKEEEHEKNRVRKNTN
tara:strand:- start:11013 stop:11234 length:222 start_codon:yes stop_codon:yes gene_type:complete